MKITKSFFLFLMFLSVTLTSCYRSSDDLWEDTKTAGRHMKRGFCALAGQGTNSRNVYSRDQFDCVDDGSYCGDSGYQNFDYEEQGQGFIEEQFVPLQDQCNDIAFADRNARPASQTPGEPGSFLPNINSFQDPCVNPQLRGIFRPIYFDYNSYMIKGDSNLHTAYNIAEYMRYHPNVYLYIEGHTDQRGADAYNFSLGSNRCHAVRNFLIQEGVNPENVFTISYGKDRPAVLENHEEAWSKNRRTEFKVYER